MNNFYDVIIVGAGMVGSTLGCALGTQGVRVLLLDRNPVCEPDDKPLRVSALNLASVDLLNELDVWSLIKHKTCPFTQMKIWEKTTLPCFNQTIFNCQQINRSALGYIIENSSLIHGLHQRMQSMKNVVIKTEAEIKNCFFSQEQSQILLADNTCFTAKLIVGADGKNSSVRTWAKIGVNRKEYGQRAIVSTVKISADSLPITWQVFTPDGPLALLPLPTINQQNYVSLVWYDRPLNIKHLMQLSADNFLEKLITVFPKELPPLVKVIARGQFTLLKQTAKQYVSTGVALVGDAAHVVHPLAGQGVNLGIMDVAILSKLTFNALYQGDSWLSCLQSYEKQRYLENLKMGMILDAFHYGFTNKNKLSILTRNALLSLAGRLGPVTKKIIAYGAGID